MSIIESPCRVDCFPLVALAAIPFSQARYALDFDDVVGTLIYSTIRIVPCTNQRSEKRPEPHPEKPVLNPATGMRPKKYGHFIDDLFPIYLTFRQCSLFLQTLDLDTRIVLSPQVSQTKSISCFHSSYLRQTSNGPRASCLRFKGII